MTPRRASVAFVIAVVYIDMLGLGLAFPVLPKLVEQLYRGDVSRAAYMVGLLSSGYALMQFLLSPALGALSDRYGRRPVILLGLAGMGANYFLLAFAPTLAWFFAARLISGATGATYTTAAAYLADITPPEKRAANFGLIGAAFGVGFITGPILGGFLGATDLRLPFLVAGVLSLANVALGWFILPESLDAAQRKPFSLARANPVGALKEMSRYKSVLGLIVVFLLATFANRVAEMTWVLFASYRFHWGPTEIGFSLAMVGVMFIVGQGIMPRFLVPPAGRAPRAGPGVGRQRGDARALWRDPARLDDLSGDGVRRLRLGHGRARDHEPDVAQRRRRRAGPAPGRARPASRALPRSSAHRSGRGCSVISSPPRLP